VASDRAPDRGRDVLGTTGGSFIYFSSEEAA
jgi:hypothetical protein